MMSTLPVVRRRGVLSRLLLWCCVASLLCGVSCRAPEPLSLTVAAAADLTPAFEELARGFERQTGVKVVYTFGSTGNLSKQIENGAPFDLFAAANVEFIDELARKGLILPETKALYARGRLTLYTAEGSRLALRTLEDLTRPEVERVAIANPEHAPYGVAAREALQAAGVWERVRDKLVFGENVREAQQYVESGNAQAGLIALSLSVQSRGHWELVPEELHRPLDQALAVVRGTRHEREARAFAAYVNGPAGRPVMRRYGFILPGETER